MKYPFDTTPKIAVYYIRKTFCESALCRGRITIPPFLVDFVTFFHAGKLPKKGGFSSVFGIIQQLLQSEAGFAEIYGRNPRENPCLIPKRKNRCFRIKSLLGAEKMPQGQYNTNAAGIGEQSVNTGSPRAAAGASPLRRRSPGGLSRWFLRTGSKSIPRPALAGSPLPFRVWVQALGWLCSCVRVRVYGWERIEMYFHRRWLKFALYSALMACLYRCMSL